MLFGTQIGNAPHPQPGAARAIRVRRSPFLTSTPSSGHLSPGRSPRAWQRPSSAWAASGGPSDGSGRCPGVYTTAVGYQGGMTPNPTYDETCTGPDRAHRGSSRRLRPGGGLLRRAPEGLLGDARPHPGLPTGNDRGSQYRSALYWTSDDQRQAAEASRDVYQAAVTKAGTRRDHHRDVARLRRSTTPRSPTSSTWRRCRTATTATPTPESPTPPDRSVTTVCWGYRPSKLSR